MPGAVQIRLFGEKDLGFADALRSMAGWNQTMADWRRLLTFARDGCFVAESGGVPVGAVTTTAYGNELAWIGMLLVHPEHRRQGIGHALLARAVDYLRDRGVRAIALDATPEGKPTYVKLGFTDCWTFHRWQRVGLGDGRKDERRGASLREFRASDRAFVHSLDRRAFGADRHEMIDALITDSKLVLVREEGESQGGFGLLRAGTRAMYLGPLIAGSAEIALELAERLIVGAGGSAVFWDVPDQHGLCGWLEARDFGRQRLLTRMVVGEICPGDARLQFGIAAPEIG